MRFRDYRVKRQEIRVSGFEFWAWRLGIGD